MFTNIISWAIIIVGGWALMSIEDYVRENDEHKNDPLFSVDLSGHTVQIR